MNNTFNTQAISVVLGRPELADLTEQATTLTASIIEVDSPETCTTAREIMVDVNSLVKEIEDQRVAAKAPFLATGKQIDALAKKLSAPLEKCIVSLKMKLATYAMRVEAERQKVEMERLRREATATQAAEDGRVPTLVTDLEIPLAADIATTTVTDYTVDMNLLPKEYCLPNEPMIRAAVKAGLTIPGVLVEKRKQIIAR